MKKQKFSQLVHISSRRNDRRSRTFVASVIQKGIIDKKQLIGAGVWIRRLCLQNNRVLRGLWNHICGLQITERCSSLVVITWLASSVWTYQSIIVLVSKMKGLPLLLTNGMKTLRLVFGRPGWVWSEATFVLVWRLLVRVYQLGFNYLVNFYLWHQLGPWRPQLQKWPETRTSTVLLGLTVTEGRAAPELISLTDLPLFS